MKKKIIRALGQVLVKRHALYIFIDFSYLPPIDIFLGVVVKMYA